MNNLKSSILSKYSKNNLSVCILGWFNEGANDTYLKAYVHTPNEFRTDYIKGYMLTYDEKVYLHYAEIYYDLIV